MLGFKTKKALSEKIREIASRGFRELDGDDLSLMLKVLELHPNYNEKKGSGVKSISIKPNAWGNSYTCWINRTDGSSIDFSWHSCLKGKKKTPEENLKQAMRRSIMEQITLFKIEQSFFYTCCPECGSESIETEIDHDYPKFRELYSEFVKNRNMPKEFDDCEKYLVAKFKKEDEAIELEWKEFHEKKANLKMICKKCNSRKG